MYNKQTDEIVINKAELLVKKLLRRYLRRKLREKPSKKHKRRYLEKKANTSVMRWLRNVVPKILNNTATPQEISAYERILKAVKTRELKISGDLARGGRDPRHILSPGSEALPIFHINPDEGLVIKKLYPASGTIYHPESIRLKEEIFKNYPKQFARTWGFKKHSGGAELQQEYLPEALSRNIKNITTKFRKKFGNKVNINKIPYHVTDFHSGNVRLRRGKPVITDPLILGPIKTEKLGFLRSKSELERFIPTEHRNPPYRLLDNPTKIYREVYRGIH